MREIRLYGSEGGGALTGSPYPYLDRLIPAQRLRPPVETSKWSETRECEAPAGSRRSPNRSHGPPT